MYTLLSTIENVRNLSKEKVNKPTVQILILSMIAGASIAFGYMANFKILDEMQNGLGFVLGASVFPIGLLIVLMAGGELLTGNMAVVATAYFHKDVKASELIKNWSLVFLGNLLGSVLVAFVFVLYLETINPNSVTLQNAILSKVNPTSMQMLISGIGCNIFVGISVWMYNGAKDGFLKFIVIWFPVMVFVILGFQHVVANMFILTIGLAQTKITIFQFINNMVFVFIGNAIGGGIFVGFIYSLAGGSLKD